MVHFKLTLQLKYPKRSQQIGPQVYIRLGHKEHRSKYHYKPDRYFEVGHKGGRGPRILDKEVLQSHLNLITKLRLKFKASSNKHVYVYERDH